MVDPTRGGHGRGSQSRRFNSAIYLGDISQMRDGSVVVADAYISAMPVDVLKRFIPAQWSTMSYFVQLDELEGIPVINRRINRLI